MPAVFISHSSIDAPLAQALVDLFTGVGISPQEIRCTSLPGYQLDPGVQVGSKLRTELRRTRCVIGLLTPSSLESSWVLAELGCAWGLGKQTYILLSDGVKLSEVPGPLRDVAATTLSSATEMAHLIERVNRQLGNPPLTNTALVASSCNKFLERYQQLLPMPASKLTAFEGQEGVFDAGIQALCAGSRSKVRIYAPTGVWKPNPIKRLWVAALAKSLANEQGGSVARTGDARIDNSKSKLGDLRAVYGLPPPAGRGRSIQQFAEDLRAAEATLQPLHGIKTAHLQYLEVNTSTIPGTGIVQMDFDVLLYCFAIHGQYAIDYAIATSGEADIQSKVAAWFQDHVIRIARNNYLQDMSSNRCLAEGFDRIRRQHRLPPENPPCTH